MSHFHVRSALGNSVSLLNLLPLEPYDALQAYIPLGPDHPESPPLLRRNQCYLCHKIFTTSGHLTRHLKVHTGARDHVCPFPGCGARCSRRDNLQQHYSSHLCPAERSHGHMYARRALAHMTTKMASESEPDPGEPPASPPPSTLSESWHPKDLVVPSLSSNTSRMANPAAEYGRHSQRPPSPLSSSHSPVTPTFPFTFSHPISSPFSPTTVEEPTSTRVCARAWAHPPPFPLPTTSRVERFEVSFVRTVCG